MDSYARACLDRIRRRTEARLAPAVKTPDGSALRCDAAGVSVTAPDGTTWRVDTPDPSLCLRLDAAPVVAPVDELAAARARLRAAYIRNVLGGGGGRDAA
jgi:hypothetical protein